MEGERVGGVEFILVLLLVVVRLLDFSWSIGCG